MKFALVAVALLLSFSCEAEPAFLLRAADLKKEPASDAATVAALAENAAVDAQERQGGWVRVKAGAAEGWVKMLALRYAGTGSVRAGDSGAAQVFNAARTGSSGTQVTTGVRGLDEQMIAAARPNAAELARMNQFASTPDAAAGFASQGALKRQTVPEAK